MARLNVKEIKATTEPGRYGDGNGLYLNIAPNGSKSWIQRVRLDGKRTDRGLGSVGKVALAEARKVAIANLAAIKSGLNPFDATSAPVEAKATPAIPTFADAARAVYDLNVEEWGRGHRQALAPAVGDSRLPGTLGETPVSAFTYSDIADLLNPLRAESHETARKVRQALTVVFNWAKVMGHRLDNPADSALNSILRKVKHVPENHKALHYSEVAAAIGKVRFGYALRQTAAAFEFLVLTAARTGEVRYADWSEIDIDAGVWEIPAERMKGKRSHRVPLSSQAIAILRQVRWIPDPDAADDSMFTTKEVKSGLIFTMPKTGKPLSENALLDRCEKDNIGATPHGFRTSFRSWAKAEYGARFEAIELCLAHSVGTSVTQAYDREDLLAERSVIMQAWADYLNPSIF